MTPTRHPDVLDQRESLRSPFLRSLMLHGGIIGALLATNWIRRQVDPFGDPNPTGGAIGVGVVNSIPMPNRSAIKNPVASDTENQAPVAPPKPVEKAKVEPPDPRAVKMLDPKAKAREQATTQKYQAEPPKPNQVQTTVGQSAGSPIFSSVPGSGGVGVGPGSTFGTRFGAYGALIRQRIAEKWRTSEVDARIKSAPVVILVFDLKRDGSVGGVALLQRSGNSTLDYSTQRAVLEAAPFPPLPQGFERDVARVEIQFELKR
jgi:protein TonB